MGPRAKPADDICGWDGARRNDRTWPIASIRRLAGGPMRPEALLTSAGPSPEQATTPHPHRSRASARPLPVRATRPTGRGEERARRNAHTLRLPSLPANGEGTKKGGFGRDEPRSSHGRDTAKGCPPAPPPRSGSPHSRLARSQACRQPLGSHSLPGKERGRPADGGCRRVKGRPGDGAILGVAAVQRRP